MSSVLRTGRFHLLCTPEAVLFFWPMLMLTGVIEASVPSMHALANEARRIS